MSILQRVASIATSILFAVGVAASSTAGRAETTTTAAPLPQPTVEAPKLPQAAADLSSDTAVTAPEAPDYATLDAAVAAQQVPEDVSRDLDCLAGAIYFEAKGEPLAGQLAVAKVIINRARTGRFASDVCGVVTQPGQFSFVRGGRIPAIDTARAAYRTAVAVAKVALADAWDNPAPAALYFHARSVGAGRGMTRVVAIGNHIFYR